jgi:hypothetical protein
MVREREHDPDAAIIWSSGGLLSPEDVADKAVGLLDTNRIVLSVPAYRAAIARFTGIAPRAGLKLAGQFKRMGERARQRS